MVKFFFFFFFFFKILQCELDDIAYFVSRLITSFSKSFLAFSTLSSWPNVLASSFTLTGREQKKRKTLGMFCFGGSEAAKRIFQLIRISFEHLSSNSAILLSFSFSATLSLPSAVAAYLKFSSLKIRRNGLVRKFQLVENFYKRVLTPNELISIN